MVSLKKKIVFITGASSGIGKACAEAFAALGAKLILTARRVDRLETLAKELKTQHKTESYVAALDVRDQKAVEKLVKNLPKEYQKIDILVNNAGMAAGSDKAQASKLENWDVMIDTNLKGLLYVIHAILPEMVACQDGHIINIGSIAGFDCYPGSNVYSATKHAVRAISYSLRMDLLGTKVRVSEIDPAAVETEFSAVRWKDEKRAAQFYSEFTPLTSEDVANSVIFCAQQPPHVNIANIHIYPTDQASAHHIYRKQTEKKKS